MSPQAAKLTSEATSLQGSRTLFVLAAIAMASLAIAHGRTAPEREEETAVC